MCARYLGDANRSLFFYESGTYGAGSGTGQWIGLVQNSTIDESTGVIPVRYMGTNTRNVDQWVDGPKDVNGTISFFPQDWKFLFFALGSNVDSGSPSPYIHTISELNSGSMSAFTSGTLSPFTSFQVEDGKKTVGGAGQQFVRTVRGCNVNTFTLNAAQGEIITCDVDYVGQDVLFTSGNPTAVTETTTRPFMWRDVRVHIPSGTVINEVKSLSLTINNNLEVPHYLNGSQVTAAPIPLSRDYEVSVTLDTTSENTKTFWESYFAGGSILNQGTGSEFNMMLEINASTGSRDAFFVFSGCKMMDVELPSPMEGVNETTLTITPKNMVAVVSDAIELYNPWA